MLGIDIAQVFILFTVLLFSLTVHEMAHAWMNVVYLSDDEYKTWLDAKKTRATIDEKQQ